MTLEELGRKYGTDKVDYHSYLPFYEELFQYRNIKRLLEIGIFEGASLRMWRDYLPEAQICGFDNDPPTLFEEERIHSFWCDQRSETQLYFHLSQIGPPWFDVIIDDAYHEPQDQINCANWIVPYLASGGVYIIEDVRQGNKEMVRAGIRYPSRVVEFEIDRLPDDRLIVIEP